MVTKYHQVEEVENQICLQNLYQNPVAKCIGLAEARRHHSLDVQHEDHVVAKSRHEDVKLADCIKLTCGVRYQIRLSSPKGC